MRVVLSTISKFHTFDVARQMDRLGVLDRLFTGRLRAQIRGEGLPMHKVSTFPYFQTIAAGMGKLGIHQYPFKTDLIWLCHQALDAYVAHKLPPCDIFDALSYCGLKSGQAAQQRGARWVCAAANSHLAFQDEILAEEYERVRIPYKRQEARFIDYAIASYEHADLIRVPSSFAKRTFSAKGVPEEKLALIPHGADLSRFQPVDVPRGDKFKVLFVGQLSVRKGIHDLVKAFEKAAIPNSQLTLIGSVRPELRPFIKQVSSESVQALGRKPQTELPRYYSQADVLVLASVEEGMALVMGQALACGCPVIATEHTGSADLFTNGVEGFEVPIRSPDAIAEKLVWLYEHPKDRVAMREAALKRVKAIGGWNDYGEQLLRVYQRLTGHIEA